MSDTLCSLVKDIAHTHKKKLLCVMRYNVFRILTHFRKRATNPLAHCKLNIALKISHLT